MATTEPAPRPNCGHGGRRFVWIGMIEQWMCRACIRSIGRLYDACAGCGSSLPASSAPFRATERFCSATCYRDRQLELQLASEGDRV